MRVGQDRHVDDSAEDRQRLAEPVDGVEEAERFVARQGVNPRSDS